MPDKKAMVAAAGAYLMRHPEELVRMARNAAALRVGLPIDALRWLAGQLEGRKAPRDVQLEPVPPGLRASAIVDLAGTAVRAAATVFIERVQLGPDELRFELRLRDVTLELTDPNAETPVATLLKSGALDLSKPGNLAAFMPRRPALLVEAHDDRIVIDLMKHPKLADNPRARRLLEAVTAVLTVKGVETDPEHLDLLLSAFPRGLASAVEALRPAL